MQQPFIAAKAIACGTAVLDGIGLGVVIYLLLRNNELVLPSAVFSAFGGLLAMVVLMRVEWWALALINVVIAVVSLFWWVGTMWLEDQPHWLTSFRTNIPVIRDLLHWLSNTSSPTQQPSQPRPSAPPPPATAQPIPEPQRPTHSTSLSRKPGQIIPIAPFESASDRQKGFRGLRKSIRDQ